MSKRFDFDLFSKETTFTEGIFTGIFTGLLFHPHRSHTF